MATISAVVAMDIKGNNRTEKRNYWTDDGKPDDLVMEVYDTFKPGDLIRREFKTPIGGVSDHYAVYVGKDPGTNEHMVVDTGAVYYQGADESQTTIASMVRYTGITWTNSPNASHYSKVPKDEINNGLNVPFSRDEIVERAIQSVGTNINFNMLSNNCEAFARGIVTGKAESTQASTYKGITRSLERFVSSTMMKVSQKKAKVKLTKYTPKEVIDQISNSRAADIRDHSFYKVMNPGFGLLPESVMQKREEAFERALRNKGDLILALKRQLNSDSEDSLVDILESVGIKRPEVYDRMVGKIVEAFPGNLKDEVRIQLYKNYLMVVIGMLNPDINWD